MIAKKWHLFGSGAIDRKTILMVEESQPCLSQLVPNLGIFKKKRRGERERKEKCVENVDKHYVGE